MENRSLVTIAEHSKEKILYLLEMAKEFEKKPNRKILDGRVVATLFFEPSTRTRLSFETAANRLGARVIGFTDPKVTSSSKGETLKDTIMMVSNYADIIVMRHFLEGAARYASEVAPVPIVNAGDGANQHPSQTMLDLYSIYKTQGTLENLNIYLVGDLKYGRTVHIIDLHTDYRMLLLIGSIPIGYVVHYFFQHIGFPFAQTVICNIQRVVRHISPDGKFTSCFFRRW